MNRITASTAIAALVLSGMTAPSGAARGLGSVQAGSRTDRQAAQLHEQAGRALREGRLAEAVTAIEQAVALSPRDVGYRMLLADAYLRSGRFDSAREAYADAAELDSSNVRASLSLALIHVAQGRPAAAAGVLDTIASNGPAADVGLAYALAGQPDRAVQILESAARSPTATARTRQNLALAYAFAGDWRRARVIAQQDVSPAEIDARMAQWAVLARPGGGTTSVAGLLGVSPGRDGGMPARLALNPNRPAPVADAPVQVAAAPEAPVVANAPFAAPSASASVRPTEAPAFWVPPEEYREEALAEAPAPAPAPSPRRLRVAAAAPAPVAPFVPAASDDGPAPEALVLPDFASPAPRRRAAPVRQAAPRVPAVPRRAAYIRAVATAPLPRPVIARPQVQSGDAPFVVQLGAFRSEANAERAWQVHARRYGLGGRAPLTATVSLGGRTLHRVAISGFASRADAGRLCGQIQANGGVCFVRASAGDASIRWAARYADPRRRNV